MRKSRSPKNPKRRTSADSSGTLKSKPTTMEPEIVDPDRNVPGAIKSMLQPGSGPATTAAPMRSLLDMLNAESGKMTRALQNPTNWAGIMKAAQEAPVKIRELEKEMGIERPIGTIGSMQIVNPFTGEVVEKIKVVEGVNEPLDKDPLHEWTPVGKAGDLDGTYAESYRREKHVRLIEKQHLGSDDRGTFTERMKRAGRRLLRGFIPLAFGWLLLAPPGDMTLNYKAPLYEWHVIDGPFETLQACEHVDEANRSFMAGFRGNDEQREDAVIRYWNANAQGRVAAPIFAARIKAEKCVLQEEL